IRMLHPFIPHITEEIYQKLPMKSEACITAQYPSLKNDSIWLELASEEAANEMDIVRDTIVAIRNIRGENRISHSEKISVRLSPSNEALQTMLENNRSQILNLATVADLQIGEAGDLMKCAVSPIELEVGNIQVIVPLEGLVDFDEEIKRLNKNIEKTEKEINGISRKLGNDNFVKNAPAEVVEKDKVQLGILKSQLGTLRESLSRLQ
ncbi:MAG: class I tRNA ligase family protein, partial [Bdellovibrionota bacterium]